MAEGGWDFDNPVYDGEGYDDYKDDDYTDYDLLNPDLTVDDDYDEFNRTIQNRSDHIKDIGDDGDTRTKLIVELKETIVNRYYEMIKEKYNFEPLITDYSNFELGDDYKTLFLKVGDRDIQLTSKQELSL